MRNATYIVGLGGTTRRGSSTELALRGALAAAETAGARTRCFDGEFLMRLPHYAPENPARHSAAVELIREIRKCDGLIIASPGYHGSVSGMVKNAIDYIEDLRTAERPYLSDMAVGTVVTGAGWQTVGSTLATLRSIVHALRGWPTPVGAGINSTAARFDVEGRCSDANMAAQIQLVGEQVHWFATMRRAAVTGAPLGESAPGLAAVGSSR